MYKPRVDPAVPVKIVLKKSLVISREWSVLFDKDIEF